MTIEGNELIAKWTVDTLHVHLASMMREKDIRDNQRFEGQQVALRDALLSQEKAVNAALQAAQQAVLKAEIAAEKRFDNVNEFRGQLADQAANLMPRNEVSVLFTAVNDKLTVIENRTTNNEKYINESRGKNTWVSDTKGLVIAIGGILVGTIPLMLYLINK